MTGYAFFDVDGTLLRLTSMKDFQTFAERAGCFQGKVHSALVRALLRCSSRLLPREALNALYYRQFAGCSVAHIATLGAAWFQELLQRSIPLWNDAALERLQWHQQQSHRVVLVSGSFAPCLEPVARHLAVVDVLCARLEVNSDRYTGKLLPPQTIGNGKATAITAFLAQQTHHDPMLIWAYGDHHSDIPMLEVATQPIVIAGDHKLETYAQRRGWTII